MCFCTFFIVTEFTYSTTNYETETLSVDCQAVLNASSRELFLILKKKLYSKNRYRNTWYSLSKYSVQFLESKNLSKVNKVVNSFKFKYYSTCAYGLIENFSLFDLENSISNKPCIRLIGGVEKFHSKKKLDSNQASLE